MIYVSEQIIFFRCSVISIDEKKNIIKLGRMKKNWDCLGLGLFSGWEWRKDEHLILHSFKTQIFTHCIFFFLNSNIIFSSILIQRPFYLSLQTRRPVHRAQDSNNCINMGMVLHIQTSEPNRRTEFVVFVSPEFRGFYLIFLGIDRRSLRITYSFTRMQVQGNISQLFNVYRQKRWICKKNVNGLNKNVNIGIYSSLSTTAIYKFIPNAEFIALLL